jgi:hypothetical protein
MMPAMANLGTDINRYQWSAHCQTTRS